MEFRNPNNSKTQRQCSDCRVIKPLTTEYWWKNSLNAQGFNFQCKPCTNTRKIACHFKKKYNLTMNQLEMKKAEQQNKCAICNKTTKVLCVDHNKRTNQVRGMLCKKCNQGLGLYDENCAYLESAINYLKSYNLSTSTRQLAA